MPLSPSPDVEVVFSRSSTTLEPSAKPSFPPYHDTHIRRRNPVTAGDGTHRSCERRRRPQCYFSRRNATTRPTRQSSTDYGSSSPLHSIHFQHRSTGLSEHRIKRQHSCSRASSHTRVPSPLPHPLEGDGSQPFDLRDDDESLSVDLEHLEGSDLSILGDPRDWDGFFAASTLPNINLHETIAQSREQEYNLVVDNSASGQMPATRRHVVDLTRDESPLPQATENNSRTKRKRERDSTTPSQPSSSKRLKSSSGAAVNTSQQPATYIPDLSQDIEEIDLVGEEDGALAATLSRQRAEQVTSQQLATSTTSSESNSLWGISCAICMDNPKDMTGTACGHYFCRQCLVNWLVSNEREGMRRSNCPSCRKALSRNKKTDVIPLVFMKGPAAK